MEGFFSDLTQNYKNQAQTGSSLNGMALTGTKAVSNQNVLSEGKMVQLQAGDSFQGEIVSVNGQEVQLQLENGQYLTAKLERELQLALGQLLTFEVKSSSESKIVLSPIYSNLAHQKTGEVALKAANVAVNDKNLLLVAKMIENGLPIDKNSLGKLYRQVLNHPQADAEDIIRLQKLGIEVNANNLLQYEHYKNLEHKLLDGIQEASGKIAELYQAQADTGNRAAANQLIDNILQLLTEPDAVKAPDKEGLKPIMENTADNTKTAVTAKTVVQNESMAGGMEIIPENVKIMSGNRKPVTEQDMILTQESGRTEGISGHMSENQLQKLLQEVPSKELPDKIAELIRNESITLKDVYRIVSQDLFQMPEITPDIKEKVYRTREFQKLLQNDLRRQWTLEAQEIEEDGRINSFYKRLLQQSTKMAQLIQDTVPSAAESMKSFQNIRDNIDFMNQLNQIFHYVQLPLKFAQSQAHGELYVYTNKKNLARKEGGMTALLHLDMEHLGNMDIFISLASERNQVTTKFYLAEESMITFLETHISELNERLGKRGYQSQTSIEGKKDDKPLIRQMEEQTIGNMPLTYQAFDIRA